MISMEQDTQTEMVAHSNAILVARTKEIGLDVFKWIAECEMINTEVGGAGNGACGGELKAGRQDASEFSENMDWLACTRDALVEVAQQQCRHGAFGLEQWRNMLQVAQVLLPRSPVVLAGANVSVAPRHANTNKASCATRRISSASNKTSWRQKRRTNCVHFAPRIAAPHKHLATSELDWVTIVSG